MIRLFHVHFPTRTLLLAVSEAFLIPLALLAASWARWGGASELWLRQEHGFLKITIVSIVCMLCMYYYDLYDSLVLKSLRESLTRLVQVLGTVCIVLALLYFAYPELRIGAGTFLTGMGLAGLFLGVWRDLFLALNRSSRLTERAAILGDGTLAVAVAEEIEKRPELGLHLLGWVGQPVDPGNRSSRIPHVKDVRELPALVERERITHVFVAMNDRRGKLPVAELLQVKKQGVRFMDGADFYEIMTGKVLLDSLRPSQLLFSTFRVSPLMRLYKRTFSVLFSIFGLLLSSPLMGLIALAIWLDSGGPIVFRQRRVGQGGGLFTLYKFRSMRRPPNTEEGYKPLQENDTRFTRVGRWLRRTRLDELPQLYNILRGDMYFVGPRPFAREEELELAEQIPFYRQRWIVKPGATGWAQVHRGYCASLNDNSEKLAYDLFYIKNMSFGLDLLILLQTTKILLLGRGAR